VSGALRIVAEAYDGPTGAALVPQVQQEYVQRYGGPDETPVDPPEFALPRGRFLVAYLGGQPVGCGGIRLLGEGVAEIKRMYVTPDVRGRGYARALLRALEEAAQEAGCREVRLETGTLQPEALALYASSGYTPIEPYGYYRCAPESRSFAKALPPQPG
jgi:GNAT superfamily N-acetyltransferase